MVEDHPNTNKSSIKRTETFMGGLESMMQLSLKKRLGIDYMSERSGIMDSRKFSQEVLLDKLDRYKTKGKRTAMTRDALVEFAA